MKHHEFLARLARRADTKVILLVLDGVGDLRTADQPKTALEVAATPHLDALAARSALGRIHPVLPGVTPGSGPGHLALFGFDPTDPAADIGRGVLEALGLGIEIGARDLAIRGNFATADASGNLSDRRAGRIPTAESERLCAKMAAALAADPPSGVEVLVRAGEGYRFVLRLRADGLSAAVADTDPQRLGVPPLQPKARDEGAAATAHLLAELLDRLHAVIADEPRANRLLLRGISRLPDLPSMADLYRLRLGAFAGYPLYRGVASVCGMEVVECGKRIADLLSAVAARWDDFDYFFLHVKQTDMMGEDGNLAGKVEVLEEVDAALPRLLDLAPDVVAITGDHSTPAAMKAHSWHPVPLLLWSERCFVDDGRAFDELEAARGHLGTFPSRQLLGLMLANGGRLAKYGA
ncbi:MAG: 2,3-bisphosphoglycerate-independent phosphoglycerate mutase [Acidobacteriota bacterium]